MIHLETITLDNWRLGLSVSEEQQEFVSDNAGILARAYAYRNDRSRAYKEKYCKIFCFLLYLIHAVNLITAWISLYIVNAMYLCGYES